jgi:hypothetical protein
VRAGASWVGCAGAFFGGFESCDREDSDGDLAHPSVRAATSIRISPSGSDSGEIEARYQRENQPNTKDLIRRRVKLAIREKMGNYRVVNGQEIRIGFELPIPPS